MIDWREWSAAAFDQAAREHKPVLLAITAEWSRASAEMDRVGFRDPGVAALVADRFVPIRVDADRRPDIDERYNLGGWPTTAFLTPRGDILWGGTFFDPPALRAALDEVSRAFAAGREGIERRAEARRRPARRAPASSSPDLAAIEWLTDLLLAALGPSGAGTRAPDLPHPSALAFLLQQFRATGRLECAETLTRALAAAPGGAIYERLDDSAALLTVLVDAAAAFDDAGLRARAADLLRHLRAAVSPGTACVDLACAALEGCFEAADVDESGEVIPFAVTELERVVAAAYRPGAGLSHLLDGPSPAGGLLADQVRAASALLAAYQRTARLPYAMLAEELMLFSRRTLWDEAQEGFRDRAAGPPEGSIGLLAEPVRPLALNCDAVRVLCRLDRLGAAPDYRAAVGARPGHDFRGAAARTLASQAALYREHGVAAACYGLALAEWLETS